MLRWEKARAEKQKNEEFMALFPVVGKSTKIDSQPSAPTFVADDN
jgi:hypothetical protein